MCFASLHGWRDNSLSWHQIQYTSKRGSTTVRYIHSAYHRHKEINLLLHAEDISLVLQSFIYISGYVIITITQIIWISLPLNLSITLLNQVVVYRFAHLHYVTVESEVVKGDVVHRLAISLQ